MEGKNNEEILVSDDWELTWPIWHMLPRSDRKEIAKRHGYASIGEFEEYMSLQKAVGDSSEPYENRSIYSRNSGQTNGDGTQDSCNKPRAITPIVEEEHGTKLEADEEAAAVVAENKLAEELEWLGRQEREVDDDILKAGGQILILPDEMLHRVFAFLPVDAYATLALVSPHWKSFTRTEAVYKRLCERLYLNQSKRRALFVSRFNNSYRTMLERRPRVKAGGGTCLRLASDLKRFVCNRCYDEGVYVMKYTRVKKIQRDMWTEIPVGAVLELVYYRYLYFQEDGRVLYALTPTPPHEMFPRFRHVCLHRTQDRSAVWGSYKVQRTQVTVEAQQEWQHVRLELTIDLDNFIHGRYGCLTFDQHSTSVTGAFDEHDRRSYEVPGEPFRFVKDKRL